MVEGERSGRKRAVCSRFLRDRFLGLVTSVFCDGNEGFLDSRHIPYSPPIIFATVFHYIIKYLPCRKVFSAFKPPTSFLPFAPCAMAALPLQLEASLQAVLEAWAVQQPATALHDELRDVEKIFAALDCRPLREAVGHLCSGAQGPLVPRGPAHLCGGRRCTCTLCRHRSLPLR